MIRITDRNISTTSATGPFDARRLAKLGRELKARDFGRGAGAELKGSASVPDHSNTA